MARFSHSMAGAKRKLRVAFRSAAASGLEVRWEAQVANERHF